MSVIDLAVIMFALALLVLAPFTLPDIYRQIFRRRTAFVFSTLTAVGCATLITLIIIGSITIIGGPQ